MTHAAHRVLRKMENTLVPTLLVMALGATALLPLNAEAHCGPKCAFRKVTKPVKSVANGGIKFATNQGQQLASVGRDEFNDMRKGASQVIQETGSTLQSSYGVAMDGMGQYFTSELEKLLRRQGRAFIRQSNNQLNTINNQVGNLSDQARAAIKRIIKVLPTKQVTSSVMADMQLIGKEISFRELGQSAKNSSWGLSYDVDAASGVFGVGGSIGIVLNVLPEPDGSIKGALVTTAGGSAALLGADAGVGHSISAFWQPGTAAESTGLALGYGANLGAGGAGGGLELGFGIPVDPKNYSSFPNWLQGSVNSLIPSVTFSVDLPLPSSGSGAVPAPQVEVSVDMTASWTQKILDFTIDPANICQFGVSVVNGVTSTKVASGSSCPGASSDSR